MNKIPSLLRSFIIVMLTMTIATTGCKKTNDAGSNGSGSGDDYFMKFKANGEQKTFESQAIIQILKKNDNVYSAVLAGYADFAGQGTKDEFGMIIFSNDPIAAGSSFQDPQKYIDNDGDTLAKLIMNYNDPSNNGYLSMGTLADKNGVITLFPHVVADAKLNISELTADYVKGTFSSTVYLSTDITLTANVKITEGEFYLRRVQ